MIPTPDKYCTIPGALEYLRLKGYKIAKSKLYDDKSIIRYQIINNIITFEKNALDKYARKFLSLDEGSDSNDVEKRLKEEIRFLKERADKVAFENELAKGQYIPRSNVEQQLAARAAFLKDNLGQGFIHSRASKICEIVRGDREHIPDLIKYWLKQIEEVFDYYSKPLEFKVPVMEIKKFLRNRSEDPVELIDG